VEGPLRVRPPNAAGRPEQKISTDTRRTEMTADTRHRSDHTGTRRFSEGIEQLPDTPEKRLTGRFSCGVEQSPDTPEKTVTRRFSHGIEQLPETPDKQALGRFSRGIEHHDVEMAR
jgi:hypothetical protein